MTMSTMKKWYAVKTRPRQEARALENLERQGFHAWLPRCRQSVRHGRAFKETVSPLFASYMFVELDLKLDPWQRVNSTFGVSRLLLAESGVPAPLPSDFVGALRARSDSEGCILADIERLQPGTSMEVVRGPFVGLVGKLLEVDGRERVSLLLSLMGTEVRVRVSRAEIAHKR